MPTYCYTEVDENLNFVPGGETIFRQFSMSEEKPPLVEKNGKEYRRDIHAEHRGTRHYPGNWPMASDALGAHPDQIGEVRSYLRSKGTDCEFLGDGRAVLESPGHRKAVAEARGFFDRNGGYSDPQKR